MRALLAVVLIGCGAPSYSTRYNITVSGERGADLHLGEIDKAVEQLDVSFAEAGLLDLGDTEQIIASKWLYLYWRDSTHFPCELGGGHREAYGCELNNQIEVGWGDCIARTAFAHELTHVVLAHHNPKVPYLNGRYLTLIEDPDVDHVQKEWWTAQVSSDEVLRKDCPQ